MFGLIFAIIFAVASIFVCSLTRSSADREQAEKIALKVRWPHPFRK